MKDYEKSRNKSETAKRFCIQDDTIRRCIKLKKDTGSLKPKKPPGNKPKIQEDELLRYLEVYPDVTYKEIGENFKTTKSTAHRACVRYSITHKKNAKVQRKKYKAEINCLENEKLVYIDESGIEEGQTRRYAKSPKGQPVYEVVQGRLRIRHTIIGALHNGKFMAPMTFNGNTDTQVFNIWIKDCLLPVLKPGQTVIMDNASFHKSPKNSISH